MADEIQWTVQGDLRNPRSGSVAPVADAINHINARRFDQASAQKFGVVLTATLTPANEDLSQHLTDPGFVFIENLGQNPVNVGPSTGEKFAVLRSNGGLILLELEASVSIIQYVAVGANSDIQLWAWDR